MLRCGLLGRKLGHSYSPGIHALLGDYEYLLFEKEPDEVAPFLREGPWDALNVTIPYKKDAFALCDTVSPEALALGSVNTLVRRDGRIHGENTDLFGFARMLDGFAPAGKKALVLGSGGASVTVQAVLRQQGARVVVISRSGEDNYGNLDRHADAELIVNATPVGMYPANGASPVDLRAFPACRGVLDLIYNPERTALLLQAEELGIPCRNGLEMLVAQAKRSSEIFTGSSIPDPEIDRVTAELAAGMRNIVLVGMPGCGKTTVGRALGEALGRPVSEADALIAQRAGMSIPEYFRRNGEAAFRRLESEVLAEEGKRSGMVLSTGGGCVTVPGNLPLLRQNGVVVWLQRDLGLLPTEGRPLSMRDGPAELYRQREPLYKAFADVQVSNDGTVEEAVRRIREATGI